MTRHRVLIRERSLLRPAGPRFAAFRARAGAIRERSAPYKYQPDTYPAQVSDGELDALFRNPLTEVHPDVRLTPAGGERPLGAASEMSGLVQVVQRISAPAAWEQTRGGNTFVAIIDTGICGSMPEFPAWKQADGYAFDAGDPWTDTDGHGSMVAAVAGATTEAGGAANGVAPGARLYSCKTSYYTSDLIRIYEWLMDRREEHGAPIIANNSYAFESCTPPEDNGLPGRAVALFEPGAGTMGLAGEEQTGLRGADARRGHVGLRLSEKEGGMGHQRGRTAGKRSGRATGKQTTGDDASHDSRSHPTEL